MKLGTPHFWSSPRAINSAFDLSAGSNRFFRLLALLTFLFFLATGFRSGWSRSETDFPNYFTAATALRHGEPLHDYFDWTWFERQMNYAGFERTIGAYTPQTPLTMLPFVPLTSLSPQNGKRVWLVLNLLFLAATAWMLSRATGFSIERIWLLIFCGFFPLYANFLYGQYYVFLLFLLTLSFYLLDRQNHFLTGSVAGLAFALKLYGGPFLLYFLAKRRYRAVLGMVITMLFLLLVAVLIFGPRDIYYYASQVFPRTLEGGSIDPYNPGVPSHSTLLKHLFILEPELNPHPMRDALWLAFFLQALVSAAVIVFLFLGASTKRFTERRDFAWFVVGVLLLSTSTGSYTYILLLLPLVLLLREANGRESALLFAFYLLLTFPLPAAWLFPKLWVLSALFVWLGYGSWSQLPRRVSLAAAAFVLLAAFVAAQRNISSYAKSPARLCEPVVVQRGALFSSFPVISRAGLFYQSMGADRYVLRWLHDGRNEVLQFEGQALHPRLAPDGNSVYFEMVANRVSTLTLFDPVTRKTVPQSVPVPGEFDPPATSPDGKWSAFASSQSGSQQIWIRDLASGKLIQLTGGNCNNSSPAWALDSQSVVFASDCSRAFGLPALYRARIPQN